MELASLVCEFEYRRAGRVGVRRKKDAECAIGKAVFQNGVRVELQFNECLAKQAFGICYCAAEPEGRPNIGYQGRWAVRRQDYRPRQIARRASSTRNGTQFGFIMAGASWLVGWLEVTRNVFKVVRETRRLGLRMAKGCKAQKSQKCNKENCSFHSKLLHEEKVAGENIKGNSHQCRGRRQES